MKRILLIALLALGTVSGCARLDPLSPELKQELDNRDGQIEDIRNNQNGLMLELGKIRQQNDINARDIANFQQGLINRNNENNGVQILQGDGALVMVFAIAVVAMLLIYHYRTQAVKNKKTAEILAQQIAGYNDIMLDDSVFMAAMNTEVEKDVYDLMIKCQKQEQHAYHPEGS